MPEVVAVAVVAVGEDRRSRSPQLKTSDPSALARIAKLPNPAAPMCCASPNTSRPALWWSPTAAAAAEATGAEVTTGSCPAATTTKTTETSKPKTTNRNAEATLPKLTKDAPARVVAIEAPQTPPNRELRITKAPTRPIPAITAKNCRLQQPKRIFNSSRSSSAPTWKSSIALIPLLPPSNRMMKTTTIGYALENKPGFNSRL